jgi:hypothetical protein
MNAKNDAVEVSVQVAKAAHVVLARGHGVDPATYTPNSWDIAPFAALAEEGLLVIPKRAQRLQLVVAGQWLGHAADQIEAKEAEDGDPEAVAPAIAYLRRLGGWLADGTPGDEPKP